jgi:histidyl-tRNA synthetase
MAIRPNMSKKKPAAVAARTGRRNEPPARLKGVKDIIPDEWRYWRLALDKALQLAKIYDFERLETPLLEPLALFERTYGKQSDLVANKLYSFVDRDNEKVALRPQFKPSIARTVVEHNLLVDETKFVKLCSCGPVFRYERVQSGSRPEGF